MSQTCVIDTCKRPSRAICKCCQKNFCIFHLNEHDDVLNSKLNPIVDGINALNERLQTMDIQKKVGYCRRKLEEWRLECHQKIDRLFEQKCHELDQLIAVKTQKQKEEIDQVQAKLTKLMEEHETTQQDIDLLQSNLCYLEGKMNNIEQICFQITIQPFIIDAQSITFKEKNEQEFDLSTRYPIYKTIQYTPGSWFPLASNDRHLLFHQTPTICLVNRDLIVVKQVSWPYAVIWDISWSSTLNGFIVMTQNNIYLVDEKTMAIENILKTPKQTWLACACSDSYIFLSTHEWGSSVAQFRLSFSIDLVKQWQSPQSCSKDECIDVMVCNNETLGLTIRNRFERPIRIELRFSETFDCIWSLQVDTATNLNKPFRYCSLTCGEWLIINSETQQLLQITKYGILKTKIKYGRIPHRVVLFGENFLVIATDTGLNFHKLKLDI